MSKKEEFDIDDDWDMDGGFDDSAWDLDATPKPKSDREAVGAVAKSTAKGAASVYVEPGRRQKLILSALPKEYTATVESLDALGTEFRDVQREAQEQLIKTSKELKRTARAVQPMVSKYLPEKFNKKLTDLLAADPDYSYNQVDPQEAKIQSTLDQVFAPPQPDPNLLREQIKDKQEAKVTSDLRRAADEVRQSNLLGAVEDIRQKVAAADGYRAVTNNYRKKMLEIGYRQLFAIQDLTQVTKTSMEKLVPATDTIVHNTALPDYAKEEFSEIYKAKIKRSVIDKFGPANFTRDFARTVGTNSKTAISSFFGTVTDNLSQAGQGMALMNDDGEEKLSPREERIRQAQMGGQMVGEYAARRFKKKYVDKWTAQLREKGEKHEGMMKTGHELKFLSENFASIMNSYAKGGGGYDGRFSGVLNPLVGMLGGILPTTNGERIATTNVADNLDAPKPFTSRSDHTLNEIIPGLLAKIDKSVRTMHYGTEQPLEQYDYTTNTFVSTEEISNRIRDKIGDTKTREYMRESYDNIINGLVEESGGELSEEDRRALGKLLDSKVRKGNHFDINDIAKGSGDAWAGERINVEVMNMLQDIVDRDKGAKYNDIVNTEMRKLQSEVQGTQGDIDRLRQMYGEGAIVRSGAFVKDGDHLVANAALRDTWQDFKGDLALPTYGSVGNKTAPPPELDEYAEPELTEDDDTNKIILQHKRRKGARSGLKGKRTARVTRSKPSSANVLEHLNTVGEVSSGRFNELNIDFRKEIRDGVTDALFDNNAEHNLYKLLAGVANSPLSNKQREAALNPILTEILEQLKSNNLSDDIKNIIEIIDGMNTNIGGIMSAGDFYDETGKRIASGAGRVKSKFGPAFGKVKDFTMKWGGRGIQGAHSVADRAWAGAKGAYDWAKETIPYTDRTGFVHGVRDRMRGICDIYDAQGNLIFSAAKLKAGEYINEAGKVIERISDIDGTIYNKDGEVIFSKEEFAEKLKGLKYWSKGKWHAAGSMFAKGIGDLASGIHNIYSTAFNKSIGLLKDEYNKKRVSTDIYVKGEESPRLRRQFMLSGMYVSERTGKIIRDVFDIDGPVKTVDGNLIITADDLANPDFELVDVNGKEFKSFTARLRGDAMERMGKAKDLIMKPLRAIGGGLKLAKDKVVDGFTSMKDKFIDMINNMDGDGTPSAAKEKAEYIPRSAKAIVNRLDRIIEILLGGKGGGTTSPRGKPPVVPVTGMVAGKYSTVETPTTGEVPVEGAHKDKAKRPISISPKVAAAKQYIYEHSDEWMREAQEGRDKYLKLVADNPMMTAATMLPLRKQAMNVKGQVSDGVDKLKGSVKDKTEKAKEFKISDLNPKDFMNGKLSSEQLLMAKSFISATSMMSKIATHKSPHDSDGDGIREGSATDIRNDRKAAREKLAEQLKKNPDPVEEVKQQGFISKLLGGFGGLLGGLFKTITTPLTLLTSMLGKAIPGAAARAGLGALASKVLTTGGAVAAGAATTAGGAAAGAAATGWGLAKVGGTIAMHALRTAGMAAIGAVSTPVLIGAGAAALVGAVGYGIYNAATSKRNDEMQQLRFAYYGSPDYTDGKSEDTLRYKFIESVLGRFVKYDMRGFAALANVDEKATLEIVNGLKVSPEDEKAMAKLNDWLFGRFIPVFLLWHSRARQIAPDVKFDVIGESKAITYAQRLEFGEKVRLPADNQIFKFARDPFRAEGGMLNAVTSAFGAGDLLDGDDVNEIHDEKIEIWTRTAKHEKNAIAKARAEGRSTSNKDGLEAAKSGKVRIGDTHGDFGKRSAEEIGTGTGNLDRQAIREGQVTADGKLIGMKETEAYQRLKEFPNTNGLFKDMIGKDKLVIRDASVVNALDAVRVKAYGISDMQIDKIEAVYYLEATMIQDVVMRGKVPEYKGDLAKLKKDSRSKFGVSASNAAGVKNWDMWFDNRFVPVFLKYIAALKMREPGANPLNVRVSEAMPFLYDVAAEIVDIKVKIDGKETSIWSVHWSPFGDNALMGSDRTIVNNNLELLKELRAKGIALEEQKRSGSTIDKDAIEKLKKASESSKTSRKNVYEGFNFSEADAKNDPSFARVVERASKQLALNGGGVDKSSDSFKQLSGEFRDPTVNVDSVYGSIKLGSESRDDVASMIKQVSKAIGADENLMLTVAMMESALKPYAAAGTSSAKGLYQFTKATWKEQLAKHGDKYGIPQTASPLDPVANTILGAEYMRYGMERIKNTTGKKDINAVDIYLSHFLGPGGANKFIKALMSRPQDIAALDFKSAAAANKGIFYDANGRPRSYQGIYTLLGQRANQRQRQIAKYTDSGTGSLANVRQHGNIPSSTAATSKGDTSANLASGGDATNVVNIKDARDQQGIEAEAKSTTSAPVTMADTASVNSAVAPGSRSKEAALDNPTRQRMERARERRQQYVDEARKQQQTARTEEQRASSANAQESKVMQSEIGKVNYEQLKVQQGMLSSLARIEKLLEIQNSNLTDTIVKPSSGSVRPDVQVPAQRLAVSVGRR